MFEALENGSGTISGETMDALLGERPEALCARLATLPARERDALADLLTHFLPGMPLESRTAMAGAVADLPVLPLRLLVALARDEIAVADPILRTARGLGEADLAALAGSLPKSHLLSIAARPGLSEAVCERLSVRGDAAVWRVLAANADARPGDAVLSALADHAEVDVELRAALAARSDLPEPVLDRLWRWLAPAERRSIVATGLTLSDEEYALLAAEPVMQPDGDPVLDAADCSVEQMRVHAEACAYLPLADMLSARTGVPARLCLALALGAYERGALLLVRAAGGDGALLEAIRRLRARSALQCTGERRGAGRMLEVVEYDEARALLADLAREHAGAPAPVPMAPIVVDEKAAVAA